MTQLGVTLDQMFSTYSFIDNCYGLDNEAHFDAVRNEMAMRSLYYEDDADFPDEI